MSIDRIVASLAAAAVVSIGIAVPALAAPVLEYTSAGGTFTDGLSLAEDVGWSFTPTQNILVTALDAFVVSFVGNTVNIYQAGPTIVATATVLPTDPTEGAPIAFFAHSITPVTLIAGTTYFIDEVLRTGASAADNATGITTSSLITYDASVSSIGGFPTADFFGHANSYFGPNFDATPVATPEPASLAILGVGLAGAGLVRRRRRSA